MKKYCKGRHGAQWDFVDGVLTISPAGEFTEIPDYGEFASELISLYDAPWIDWEIHDDYTAKEIIEIEESYFFNTHDTPDWYDFRESITKIVIDEGITAIGDYAFWGCSSVKELIVPSTITYFGEDAFHDFGDSHTKIFVPKSVIDNPIYEELNNLLGFITNY